MIAERFVPPEQIEAELVKIWDELAKENRTRACLFNLIVFSTLSPRTDYFHGIVQKVIDSHPSRVLFITHDSASPQSYLKAAVSIAAPAQDSLIACDKIDIGNAGSDWQKVPSIILPHIVPDLPVILLWTEDPSKEHPLFNALKSQASRIIFDSESADKLLPFVKALAALKEEGKAIADLNWARLEGWRDLLSATFEEAEYLPSLSKISSVKLTYNARKSDVFCHLAIQSFYLLSLFAARLSWKVNTRKDPFHMVFESNIAASIEPESWQNLGPGAVISLELATADGRLYSFSRIPASPHTAIVHVSTPEHCELPYFFQFGKSFSGRSLVREIFQTGTSPFFLETLNALLAIDQGERC